MQTKLGLQTEVASEVDSRGRGSKIKITVFIIQQRRTFIYYMNHYSGELDDMVCDYLIEYCKTGNIIYKKIHQALCKKYVKMALHLETKTSKFSEGILLALERK